jgi:uncharacterized RDD family membrane protein YckC
VRCPNCGFVSFDDLDSCKKCGHDLAAVRAGRPVAKESLFSRLRRRAAPTDGPAKVARERSEGERRLQAREEHLEQKRAELHTAYTGADSGTRREIRNKLDEVDRERNKLRLHMEKFEQEFRRREEEIRRELDTEREAAKQAREQAAQMQKEMAAQLADAQEAREQAQQQLEQAQQAAETVQEQLREAQTAQSAVEEELAKARQEEERLHAEAERAQRARTEGVDQARKLAAQEAEVHRLEDERRLLFEAAQRLQEERERLEVENFAAERQRHMQQRKRVEQRAQKPAPVAVPELPVADDTPPPPAAPTRSAPPRQTAPPPKPTPVEQPAPTPPSPIAPPHRPTARPEDLLELYGRRRKRPAPPPTQKEPPPFVDEEPDFEDEEILEKIEHQDVRDARAEVAAKGGLVFRSLAGAIDLALLMVVVGGFLAIGFFLTGVSARGFLAALGSLGLPFYIVFLFLSAAYFTYMHGVYGQTLGKRLLGLRVVTTHGDDLGYLTAFIRFVAACFAIAAAGMGVFWIALDPNKQGWHDKLSRTVVVRL